MIHWLPQLTAASGLPIKSPVSGAITALNAHPQLCYNADVLPQAVCIILQHGTLCAPFTGQYSSSLHGGRRLSFKHQGGLKLQLDLPEAVNENNGTAVKHLVRCGQTVQAGQPVMKLDLQLLPADSGRMAVLMIAPHPAITSVISTARYVEAVHDTAFIIQLKNS